MAKNYMQDITPLRDDESEKRPVPVRKTTRPGTVPRPEPRPEPEEPAAPPPRSIRNIAPATRRPTAPRRPSNEIPADNTPRPPRRSSRGTWLVALISVIALAGLAALVFIPSTAITVTPHTHVIPFDSATPLVAYPEGSAATGTIRYTVATETFEDSALVAANGIENVSEKASGNITVINEYSDQPVRLIKNTRFEGPGGLIFRIPASVDVPARKNGQPGTIDVTVFADQSGEEYNIQPVDRFTIPGLKDSPEMYNKVYARSSRPFEGGFVGERPAVSPATLDATRAEIRTRVSDTIREFTRTLPQDQLAFPGLMAVTFEALPPIQEGEGVRIRERATAHIPVFQAQQFADALAQAVSANAEGQNISIQFSPDTSAESTEPLSVADLGTEPLTFTLNGRGKLIWVVDGEDLRAALAGRDEAAFQTIIQNFPSIETAEARIAPFWRRSFPADPAEIEITIQPPSDTF